MMFLAVVSERWPFWLGGLAIGTVVLALLLTTRNLLGVSSGFADACAAPFDARLRRSWRLPLLLGIVVGGLLGAVASGSFAPTTAMGMFDSRVTSALAPKLAIFFGGGILLGFGARLANGCTSGHGIVGTALLAKSSWIATAVFMLSGFVVTQLLLGGAQ
ncbi:MAG: YeeE/YedE family protein [Deltaproteobacteria bacterium]|nr:YeeE/YedE family protein [Nannocystaceae bacterium]